MSEKVGIGLPVYNNAAYLEQTLRTIIDQQYQTWELYIVDDNSSDGSHEICKRFAAEDSRITFIRHEENQGPWASHKAVLEMATTSYFMFARPHELLPENLLGDCLDILQADPDVVLAFARARWVNPEGEPLHDRFLPLFDTRGCDVVTRCALNYWSKCEGFYGVGLTENFLKCRILEPVVGHDLIMLMEFALLGTFAMIDKGVRYRRYHYTADHKGDYVGRMQRHQKASSSDDGVLTRHFPVWKLPFYLFGSIWHSRVSVANKCLITLYSLVAMPVKFLVSRGKGL